MGETKETLTLLVQMANLPSGPNYAQQTIFERSSGGAVNENSYRNVGD
jgi:hypothetical protein